MTRDSQISKVYTAIVVAGDTLGGSTHSPDEIAEIVKKAMNSAWYQKRWAEVGVPLLVKEVNVRVMQSNTYCDPQIDPMKKRANAKRPPYSVDLRMAPSAVTLLNAFHLITHLIHPGQTTHDAEYCRTYLQIVGRFMGADAKKHMTQVFRNYKVKHRVYSPEAREAAAARFIARRSVPDLVALRDELAGS